MLHHALVTGASAGLGRELVRQLVRDRGMIVWATARRADRLTALAAELPEGRVRCFPGDLSDPQFRASLWEWAETGSGGIHLLVNNAGIGHYSKFSVEDPQHIRQIVEINLMALLDLTQRALRAMQPRGSGQVLQVSSTLGFIGLPYSATYVATKHAVNGLVKSLRYELRGTGVRVWAACPGRTESEFYEAALGVSATGRMPRGEPTERVVRGIVRGLDRRAGFWFPTRLAGGVVRAAQWLPGPFHWWMERWSAGHFAAELAAARAPGRSEPPSPPRSAP